MTATAWADYLAAARLARLQLRPQQAEEADRRAGELQPQLMLLDVRLAPQATTVTVTRNGEEIAEAELGRPFAVDPGSHVLRASAPGYSTFVTTVLLTQPGQIRSVTIPALVSLKSSKEDAPRAPEQTLERVKVPVAPVVAPGAATRGTPAPRTIPMESWVAGGVGAAALLSSAVLAAVAKSKWDEAHERGSCDRSHACNLQGLRETDHARQLGNVATIGVAVGAVSLVSALLFYTSSTPNPGAPARVGLMVSPASTGLDLRGAF